ncbi:uncharacterized protein LOC144477435, partial [Augochlora pura]
DDINAYIEKGISIVVISDPYRILDNWYGDLKHDTANWVTPMFIKKSSNIQILIKDKGVVAIAIDELRVFSCYISPNIPMGEFQEVLALLEKEVSRVGPNHSIIAGDLNAKAVTWGSRYTVKRGYEVLEMTRPRMTWYPLEVEATTPLRETVTSIILDEYTTSDHRYVKHIFRRKDINKQPKQRAVQQTTSRVDLNKFIDKLQEWTWATDSTSTESIDDIDEYILRMMQLAKEASREIHPSCTHKKAVWWWSENTARARKEVIHARRNFQRARAKQTRTDILMQLKDVFNNKKKKLKIEINKAKNDAWLTFIGSIDQNPWGKPYKWIVNQAEQIIDKLFVTTPHARYTSEDKYTSTSGTEETDGVFSEEEVAKAIKKVKRKALGLDLIPSEVVWEIGKGGLWALTQVINGCYVHGYFPRAWRNGRLLLIPKKQGNANAG